ncbi:hypothetical protein [Flavicella sp.]|uniref:hypothetical protein n=1 Tax=Flavicella sp. TaxID=2957742 RepID=UPI00262D8CE1|nr:hypothetical protein [Flavicella sp.]MDG1803715.1 hypothetical protein [Flavicella sp.]MDG2279216.1 hypothetical protein [Flavicella sp.]
MKNYIKNKFILLILGLVILSFHSCNHTNDIEEGNVEPNTPVKTIVLGFGLELEPVLKSANNNAKTTVAHNYEKQGYKVIVEGGIVGGNQVFKHVDLTQKLEIQINGPIQVTVVHLGFKENELQDRAYFGTDSQDMNPIEDQNNIVDLELVQGYVSITTSSFIEGFVELVTIDNEAVDMNTVYYSGKQGDDIKVNITVFGRSLKGQHTNVLGEGIIYDLTFSDIIGNGSKKTGTFSFDDLILDQIQVQ